MNAPFSACCVTATWAKPITIGAAILVFATKSPPHAEIQRTEESLISTFRSSEWPLAGSQLGRSRLPSNSGLPQKTEDAPEPLISSSRALRPFPRRRTGWIKGALTSLKKLAGIRLGFFLATRRRAFLAESANSWLFFCMGGGRGE